MQLEVNVTSKVNISFIKNKLNKQNASSCKFQKGRAFVVKNLWMKDISEEVELHENLRNPFKKG